MEKEMESRGRREREHGGESEASVWKETRASGTGECLARGRKI